MQIIYKMKELYISFMLTHCFVLFLRNESLSKIPNVFMVLQYAKSLIFYQELNVLRAVKVSWSLSLMGVK